MSLSSRLATAILLVFPPALHAQGDYWTEAGNPLGSEVNTIATDDAGIVFAGTQSNGVFRSTDNGATWELSNNGLPDLFISAITVSPLTGTVIVNGFQVVYRSTDDGVSWASVATGTSTFRLACSPSGGFFAGTPVDGVLRSTDDGLTWEHVNQGLTQFSIYAFAFGDDGYTYTSSYSNAVYRSTNSGSDWVAIPLPGMPADGNALAAEGAGNVLCGTSGRGVFLSTDHGDLWTEVNNGLSGVHQVRTLQCNSLGHVFAATDIGVFRTIDLGGAWWGVNEGLTDPDVRSLCLAPDGYLYAGTASGQVYRSLAPTTRVRDETAGRPEAYSLSQSYPNPFNPVTTITYMIGSRQSIFLRVYDILGREVAVLVNEIKEPGTYSAAWYAAGHAGGVYFYRLEGGSFVETKRLVLLR